jgi:hypothetical protein
VPVPTPVLAVLVASVAPVVARPLASRAAVVATVAMAALVRLLARRPTPVPLFPPSLANWVVPVRRVAPAVKQVRVAPVAPWVSAVTVVPAVPVLRAAMVAPVAHLD